MSRTKKSFQGSEKWQSHTELQPVSPANILPERNMQKLLHYIYATTSLTIRVIASFSPSFAS